MTRLSDAQLAYALLRFGFGVNLALHGVNRIAGGIGRFAVKMADDFAPTILPRVLVMPFGALLPFVELAVGALLVAGALTRGALVAGSLAVTALMFGTALRGDWNVLGIQVLYALVYYVLLARRADDALGIDAVRRGSRGGRARG